MNKQGISATTKGCCTACDKPIVGQVRIRFSWNSRLMDSIDGFGSIGCTITGGDGFGTDVASGALCLLALSPGAGHAELFRTRRTALLRARLPPPLFAALRLLQRTHFRCKTTAQPTVSYVFTLSYCYSCSTAICPAIPKS